MEETSILVHSIGPVVEVQLDSLKRVNVFTGPSEDGKYTIIRVVTQLIWCEKTFITIGEQVDIKERLMAFYRFNKTYFSSESRIEYCSPWATISFQWDGNSKRFKTTYSRRSDSFYRNVKIQYIPSERNLATAVPNLQRYNGGINVIFQFIQEWFLRKGKYNGLRSVYRLNDVEGMNLAFRTAMDGAIDYVQVNGSPWVELRSCSVGVQSILPLLLVADATLMGWKKRKPFSLRELENLRGSVPKELYPTVDELNRAQRSSPSMDTLEAICRMWGAAGYCGDYAGTLLSVEDPEHGVFPTSHRSISHHLYSRLDGASSLMVTTNSPHVLQALGSLEDSSVWLVEKGCSVNVGAGYSLY